MADGYGRCHRAREPGHDRLASHAGSCGTACPGGGRNGQLLITRGFRGNRCSDLMQKCPLRRPTRRLSRRRRHETRPRLDRSDVVNRAHRPHDRHRRKGRGQSAMDGFTATWQDGVLRLSGELDLATDETLLTAFRSASNGASEVILDLSELRFIDSTGIRAFMTIAKEASPRGLVLRSPQRAVRKVIDLLRLENSAGLRVDD